MQHVFYYLFKYLSNLIIAAIFTAVLISFTTPFNFFQNYKFLIILSDSMRPSLNAGDIVVLKTRLNQLHKNDIISFRDPDGSEFFITHRVKAVLNQEGKTSIQTKGDANQAADKKEVRPQDIYGKVFLAFPFIGYVLEFTKTFTGFLMIIVLPSVMIIANELAKVKLYFYKINDY